MFQKYPRPKSHYRNTKWADGPRNAHAFIWNSRGWLSFKGETVLQIGSTEAQPIDEQLLTRSEQKYTE